ncbi:DNA helicase, putative [Plasmodium malariae]|uniref:Helicase n=1 Tax=Plasmodium malariae TaxID=5858 RepID=A0A1A8W6U9_PLAMA|nr:DNA helicase, putative [Plasmodium malariae]SBS86889.1 helicase [Plasmodium malariae]SCO93034.1 DNA helicase, putative [Plasmodium malariae]
MEVFNFGKYNGKTFQEVFEKHKSYVTWVKNLDKPTGSLIQFKNYILQREGESNETDNMIDINLNSEQHSSNNNTHENNTNCSNYYERAGCKYISSADKSRNGNYNNNCSSRSKSNGKNNHIINHNINGNSNSNSNCKSNENNNGNDNRNSISRNNGSNSNLSGVNGCSEGEKIVGKMNSSEYRNYEQNIMKEINDLYNQKEEKVELDIVVAFEIFSGDSFKIVQKDNNSNRKFINFKNFVSKELFKILSEFNPTIKKVNNNSCITFESDKYEYVLNNLKEKCTILGGVQTIPNFLLKCFKNYSKFSEPKKISEITANILTNTLCAYTKEHYDKLDVLIGEKLNVELKNFQREGVYFGLKKNGRVLIGDEMGLGKTLQALALMAFYHKEWPFIVVCPSSIRFQWKDQALRWLSHLIHEEHICVVKSGKAEIPRHCKMIIISYELITKNDKYQNKYNCIVCDESHYLKNSFSKRTKAITPIIKNAKRCVLLSGTPALNKPSELYEQVSSIIPNLFNYNEFCERYCFKDKNIYTRKIEYVGCKHTEELHLFLTNTIMIRRLKKDVLKELPEKLRSKIPVEIPPKELGEILNYYKKLETKKNINIDDFDDIHLSNLNNSNSGNGADDENISISHLFKMTGYAKVKAIKEYISYLIDADIKFLLFCHHKLVMDEIDQFLKEKKTIFIRVDGLTPIEKREIYIKSFQNDENVKIALLSLTACGIGLNLTAANTVVFGELYWVPGQIIQAEDRAHRIGTSHENVNIHYLIAQNTIDEIVWKIINRKWNTLTTALNGMEDSLNVKEVNKFDKFMLDLTNDTNKSYPTSLVNTPKVRRRSSEYKPFDSTNQNKKDRDIRDFFKSSDKSVEKLSVTKSTKKRLHETPTNDCSSSSTSPNLLSKKYKTELL